MSRLADREVSPAGCLEDKSLQHLTMLVYQQVFFKHFTVRL